MDIVSSVKREGGKRERETEKKKERRRGERGRDSRSYLFRERWKDRGHRLEEARYALP